MIGIVSAVIFIVIVVCHRPCRTLTVFLVLNTVFDGFVANMIKGSQSVYMLIDYENGSDGFCVIRAYLMYSSASLIYHSTLLQTIHRLFINVFPHRRHLQSKFVFAVLVFTMRLHSIL
jgi:hypothetical protein